VSNIQKNIHIDMKEVFLDITEEICPFTFVRTKLLVERMRPGQIAEIRLKGKEPLENVPRALRDQGEIVLSLHPETPDGAPDGPHRLRFRKASRG
jgi:tRNA 2-thiouridine synthesizing protein A